MTDFKTKFEFGDRLIIDKDPSLAGTVTAFKFCSMNYQIVELSWVHNGTSLSAFVEEWRLEKKQ